MGVGWIGRRISRILLRGMVDCIFQDCHICIEVVLIVKM